MPDLGLDLRRSGVGAKWDMVGGAMDTVGNELWIKHCSSVECLPLDHITVVMEVSQTECVLPNIVH